jgi:aryl-alcohol dehydrogenase-like predicted oxidoreductase
MISSKLLPGPDGSGFRPDEVRRGCEASLARLGRDRLDIYLLHEPDERRIPHELDDRFGVVHPGEDNPLSVAAERAGAR